MLALLKTEFLHYRKWAIGLLALQAMAWAIVLKLNEYTDASAFDNEITQILSLFGGFIFGVVQMVLITRKNHWAFLLQRPLNSRDIYFAITAASTLHIFIAFPLVWLAVVAGFDLFTNTVVDMRHYYMAPYLMMYSVATYLIGNLVVLNASRAAILTGFGLLTLHNDLPQFTWLKFLILALVIIILLYLNIKSFKADRFQPLKSVSGIVLMAIPMQVILVFFLTMSTALFYDIPQTLMGTHPEQHPTEGSFEYWRNIEEDKRIAYLLKDSDMDNKTLFSRQTELADKDTIATYHSAFNRKNQLNFRDNQWFLSDEDSRTVWVFSHDEMMLQGSDNFTGEHVGWLGQQGFLDKLNLATDADRFITVPSMIKNQFIVTDKLIFQVDFANKQLSVKLMMTGGEYLIGRPEFKEHFVALVTNKQTYLFAAQTFLNEFELAATSYQLPHPVALENLSGLESYRMADGFLLIYRGQDYYGFDKAGAEILYAHANGDVEKIHSVRFNKQNTPEFIQHFDYLISPAIYTLRGVIRNSFQSSELSKQSNDAVLTRPWSSTILITIILLQVSAAIVVLILARRFRLNHGKTVLWVLMSLVVGIPSLLSFLLLNKRA
ncbi:MAG: hypothetical protein MJK12_19990 [Colwellia sp.]|nr:hypothetical protein [Colwellia sp.]